MYKHQDLISIIMGVYNAESTLRPAILSIINQTYTCWELIICDDGSTDDSFKIAQEFDDKRIVLISNNQNMGLGYTLNRCLEIAKGSFIARMDADDISMPDRLRREHAFLVEHSEYAVVSCSTIKFDDKCDNLYAKPVIENPDPKDFIIGNPVVHPACMIRRECLEAVGGYNENKQTLRVEDIDLWIRLLEKHNRFYNFPEPLHKVRFDYATLERQKLKYRWRGTLVRFKGCKKLKLPFQYYFLSFRTLLIGLVPVPVRYRLHIRMKR